MTKSKETAKSTKFTNAMNAMNKRISDCCTDFFDGPKVEKNKPTKKSKSTKSIKTAKRSKTVSRNYRTSLRPVHEVRKGVEDEDEDEDEEPFSFNPFYNNYSSHSEITDAELKKIFCVNAAAASVHAASCIAIILLNSLLLNDKTFTMHTNYPPRSNSENEDGWLDVAPDSQIAFNINIGWLVGGFLGASAITYGAVCTCLKTLYEDGLEENLNIFRWTEYAASASLVRVVVSILAGINDVHMIFLQFGLTATSAFMGLSFEIENKKRRLRESKAEVNWFTYWLRCIPNVCSWFVIISYVLFPTGKSPPLLYAMVFSIFILDTLLFVVSGLQWGAKGIFHSYINSEMMSTALSVVNMNFLAWAYFFGSQP